MLHVETDIGIESNSCQVLSLISNSSFEETSVVEGFCSPSPIVPENTVATASKRIDQSSTKNYSITDITYLPKNRPTVVSELTTSLSSRDMVGFKSVNLLQQQAGSDKCMETSPALEHVNIGQFPTDQLLDMFTGLFCKIISYNDKHLPFDQNKHDLTNKYAANVLSFRGKHIPAISLGDYMARIQKYCPISNDVFLSLLVYFDRIAKRCNDLDPQLFVMDSYNIHRLIIAAITVSTKFFSDFFYSNSLYARVGGITLQELNRLELHFTILCDFELIISVHELQSYADLLYKFWSRENCNSTLVRS